MLVFTRGKDHALGNNDFQQKKAWGEKSPRRTRLLMGGGEKGHQFSRKEKSYSLTSGDTTSPSLISSKKGGKRGGKDFGAASYLRKKKGKQQERRKGVDASLFSPTKGREEKVSIQGADVWRRERQLGSDALIPTGGKKGEGKKSRSIRH